jgi:hypothetical protein
MITYKIEMVERKVIDMIFCDRCEKVIDNDMEEQELHFISFTGGYGSVFGDGVEVETVLCQHCLYELIKDFYKIKEGNQ